MDGWRKIMYLMAAVKGRRNMDGHRDSEKKEGNGLERKKMEREGVKGVE